MIIALPLSNVQIEINNDVKLISYVKSAPVKYYSVKSNHRPKALKGQNTIARAAIYKDLVP